MVLTRLWGALPKAESYGIGAWGCRTGIRKLSESNFAIGRTWSKGNAGTLANTFLTASSLLAFHSQKMRSAFPSSFVSAHAPTQYASSASCRSSSSTRGVMSSGVVGCGSVWTAMYFARTLPPRPPYLGRSA